MTDAKRRYYLKNAEKIKKKSNIHYHSLKERAEKADSLCVHMSWQLLKMEHITKILAFSAVLNVITLIIFSFMN